MRKRFAATTLAAILASLFLATAPVAASDYSLTILSVDTTGQLSPDRTVLTVSGLYSCTASDPAPIDPTYSQLWGQVTQGSVGQISDEDFIPTCDQTARAFSLRFTRASGWANGQASASVGGTLCSAGCTTWVQATWYQQQLTISGPPAPTLARFPYYVSQFTARVHSEIACGPTAAAMLLRWWGQSSRYPTVNDVIANLPSLSSGATGWWIWDLASAIGRIGGLQAANGITSQGAWESFVNGEVNVGRRPVIALLVTTSGLPRWGSGLRGHYVLITGIDMAARVVRYQDPAKGANIDASFDQFQNAWGAAGGNPNAYQYIKAYR